MSCNAHWSEPFVNWLRGHIPEANGVPIYLRNVDEMPEWIRTPGAFAWASTIADLQMRDILTERGEWAGRGHFVGLSDKWMRTELAEQRAILLHEMAHSISDWETALLRKPEEEFTDLERTLMEPDGVEKIRAIWDLQPLDEGKAERSSHGAKWIRCCLHLWSRAWLDVTLMEMMVFSDRYALSEDNHSDAVRSLLPVLWRGGDLTEVLKSDPPPDFAALFEANTGG